MAELTEDWSIFPFDALVPNSAIDSAQPFKNNKVIKRPNILFILPFLYFFYFKQRFARYKTNESLKLSLYLIQPTMEELNYEISLKGFLFKQLSRFSIICK